MDTDKLIATPNHQKINFLSIYKYPPFSRLKNRPKFISGPVSPFAPQ